MPVDKKALVERYVDRGLSLEDVAAGLDVRAATVTRKLIALRIPIRSRGSRPGHTDRHQPPADVLTRRVLVETYQRNGLTIAQVAEQTGVSYDTVRRFLRQMASQSALAASRSGITSTAESWSACAGRPHCGGDRRYGWALPGVPSTRRRHGNGNRPVKPHEYSSRTHHFAPRRTPSAVDSIVVAVADQAGGATVLSSDPVDLRALSRHAANEVRIGLI